MPAASFDEFIEMAAEFARPVLAHWRALVRDTVPEASECIKWGMPHFTVGGKILTGMGAFKAHCSLIVAGAGERGGDGEGHFGRITSLESMPGDSVVRELLLARLAAIRGGATQPARAREAKAQAELPDDLAAALGSSARSFLESLSPSQKRDYFDWITSAKRPETRARRVAEAAQWLAEGRKRYWKYEKG